MTAVTHRIRHCARVGLLASALFCSAVFADEYTPVNDLLRSGQLDQAMAKADAYLATNPRDPQMQFLRALIQQDGGKQAEAIDSYNKIISAYPELPEPYNNVAVLYAAQGQYDKARAALEMAIRNSGTYATAYENLGDVYARLASQSYSQAQQFEPGNATLAPKLALIRQLLSAPSQIGSASPTDKARPPTPAVSTAR
ncbi:MAG: tetratricopeptide repeat protein [Burkholderiaceae bacterium]